MKDPSPPMGRRRVGLLVDRAADRRRDHRDHGRRGHPSPFQLPQALPDQGGRATGGRRNPDGPSEGRQQQRQLRRRLRRPHPDDVSLGDRGRHRRQRQHQPGPGRRWCRPNWGRPPRSGRCGRSRRACSSAPGAWAESARPRASGPVNAHSFRFSRLGTWCDTMAGPGCRTEDSGAANRFTNVGTGTVICVTQPARALERAILVTPGGGTRTAP